MFTEELEFFIRNQADLVAKYNGKVLVIKGQEVIGVYPDPLKAYLEKEISHEPGSFMIQPCGPGPEAYSVTISSTEISMKA